MARILCIFMGLGSAMAADTCLSGACGEAEIEELEASEAAELRMELLQHAKRVEKEEKVVYAPYWCDSIDAYTRSTIPSCNGGPGGCVCLGEQVCGTGAILPGTWQSYSYSCCGCSQQVSTTIAPTAAPETTAAPAAEGADCALHPECQKLGLTGSCCPSAQGATLGCCTVSTDVATGNVTTVAGTPAPVADATPSTATGTKIPAWCATVPESSKTKIAACTGAGIESGGCECLGTAVCGEGAPKAGSWQSYSSACCGCN